MGTGGLGGQTGGKNCPQVLSAKRDEEGGRRCEVEEDVEKEKVKGGKSFESVEEGGGKSGQEEEGFYRNGEEEMRDVEQGERNGEKGIEANRSEEKERRRKLWEGERRRNEERRRREEERRREEKQGDRWRLGREVRGGEEEDEEERKRREEASRSNARMERRWNELTSSTRWNGGRQQKEEMGEKRQETHLGPAVGSYEAGSRRRRGEEGGGRGEEDDEDLPEDCHQLSTEMMVSKKTAVSINAKYFRKSPKITWRTSNSIGPLIFEHSTPSSSASSSSYGASEGQLANVSLDRLAADTQLCRPQSAPRLIFQKDPGHCTIEHIKTSNRAFKKYLH